MLVVPISDTLIERIQSVQSSPDCGYVYSVKVDQIYWSE